MNNHLTQVHDRLSSRADALRDEARALEYSTRTPSPVGFLETAREAEATWRQVEAGLQRVSDELAPYHRRARGRTPPPKTNVDLFDTARSAQAAAADIFKRVGHELDDAERRHEILDARLRLARETGYDLKEAIDTSASRVANRQEGKALLSEAAELLRAGAPPPRPKPRRAWRAPMQAAAARGGA